MSLQHLILALLKDDPLSGYDLNKRIQDTLEHFWSTNRSQVYRTLHKMHDEGWVNIETIIQTEAPSKKVYHLSPQGRATLHEWLSKPVADEPVRLAWVAQIYFADLLSTDELLDLLDQNIQREKEYQAALEVEFQRHNAELDDPSLSRKKLLAMLSLDVGIEGANMMIAWYQKAKKLISDLDNPS